jgi:hypothetical protein
MEHLFKWKWKCMFHFRLFQCEGIDPRACEADPICASVIFRK